MREEKYEIFYKGLIAKAVNLGEVLTDKAEDNPKPNLDGDIFEGSTTRSRVSSRQ
jgi:hypothetical protein